MGGAMSGGGKKPHKISPLTALRGSQSGKVVRGGQ